MQTANRQYSARYIELADNRGAGRVRDVNDLDTTNTGLRITACHGGRC